MCIFFRVLAFSGPFCFFKILSFTSSIYLSCFSIRTCSTSFSILFSTYLLAKTSTINLFVSVNTSIMFLSVGTVCIPLPSLIILFSAYSLSYGLLLFIYFSNLYFTTLALILESFIIFLLFQIKPLSVTQ